MATIEVNLSNSRLDRKCLRAARLPEYPHWHSLRRTFAPWTANGGVPVHIIKRMMRHSSINTTEMYTGIDQQVVAEELKKVTLPPYLPSPWSAKSD
jgi:site-specific recombinase XerD